MSADKLVLAARKGDFAGAVALLKKGADPNAADKTNALPLHTAAANGHASIVELLGKREDVDVDEEDARGFCPLHHGCMKNKSGVVRVLITKLNAAVNLTNRAGMTPLGVAAQYGSWEAASALIDAAIAEQVDVDADLGAVPPLVLALESQQEEFALQLLERAQNGDVSIDVEAESSSLVRPLHAAARHGMDRAFDEIMRLRPLVNAKDGDENTPLLLAAQNGHARLAERLIVADADVDHQNKDGISPITAAVAGEHWEILNFLLDHANVRVDVQEGNGKTALFYASDFGNGDVVKDLLRRGADPAIGVDSASGRTCLHAAVGANSLAAVRHLTAAGADIDAKDNQGNKPEDEADDAKITSHINGVRRRLRTASYR